MGSKYTPDRKYPATSRNFEGKRSEVDGKLSPSEALEQDNNNIGRYNLTCYMFILKYLSFERCIQGASHNCDTSLLAFRQIL